MLETLKSLLVEELSVNEADITPDANLVEDLGLNSLELADLVLHCEEQFGLEISDEDAHEFLTVGDVVKYLEETAGKK